MYKRRYARRAPLRRRKYIRRARGKKRVSALVKSYVKKAIHRNIENKEKIFYAANQTITTSDIASCTYPLLPTWTQGTADDNRVGNQVRVVKGQLKFTINLLPYDATYNEQGAPQWVKYWIVRDLKNSGQLSMLDSTSYGCFFRGNGTTLGMQSNTLDMNLPVNESYFRVLHSRCFKLGATTASTQYPTNYSFFDNSPNAKQITINWGKWCKKQIKFQEGNSYPQNENLYIVFQVVPCSGANAAGKKATEFHYVNTVTFEDA